jgi:pimeloyl-ACP methyl ester carboxylesterase
MRRGLLGLLAWASLTWAGGCASQPYLTPERLQRGLVVVLPGIEGRSPLNESVCDGLNLGGVSWGIELRDWTSWLGPLYTLRAEARNRRQAGQIALRIAEYKYAHPDNPVVVVGQSGGGAVALWVAEAMPAGMKIDGLILLAPAVSPGYLLDFALENTSRGIVSFYSSRDWLFLGVGTTVYGTMDGYHSASAGKEGFTIPTAGGRPRCYDGLYQIAWHEQMAAMGHTGGHLSATGETFVAAYVAPFVRAGTWSEEFVANVLRRKSLDAVPMPRMNEWRPPPSRPPAARQPATRGAPLGANPHRVR